MLNRGIHCLFTILFCCSVPSFIAFAQEPLTLRQVMADPIWMGELPSNVHFSPDSKHVYFQVAQPIPHEPKWLRLSVDGGTPEAVSGVQLAEAMITSRFPVGEHIIYDIDGDLWVAHGDGAIRPLLSASDNIDFSRAIDGHRFVFQRDNQLYLFDMRNGSQIQLTNLKTSDAPKEKEDWYINEEKQMLDFVAELHERDDLGEERDVTKRDLGVLNRPAPAYLGTGHRISSLSISPDLKFVSVLMSAENDGDSTEYAEFINKEAKVKAKPARPKVGHFPKTMKWKIVTLADGNVNDVDISELPTIEDDPLAEIKTNLPDADRAFLPKDKDGPRDVWMADAGFAENSNQLLMTVVTQDYKDRWIVVYDADSQNLKLVKHHHDPAWVGVWARRLDADHYHNGTAWWYQPAKGGIAWVSDASGFHHLYTHDLTKGETKQLTSGEFEIHHPYADLANERWLFHANKTHPGEIHYFSMDFNGGEMQPLTFGQGFHEVTPSADGAVMAGFFSSASQPPVLYLKKESGNWEKAYDGTSQQFRDFNFMVPDYVTYKNRDDQDVHARVYRPDQANGAGVIFVHGAGYLQNAHKGWSGYFREYMFHNLLVREGYTVLDPDYRASAGYGRDWRTAIYRHMGGNDLEDIIDGAAYMAKAYNLDEKRLGVYGGSYGGFLTLMAMFNEPDVFQSGAALRPVTDWAYYNNWYTSRILNTPTEDPESYRRSSPIYFAEGLTGHLLIAHGMVDDNVQYQDSVRLAQKLIELRKHNWELAGYPVEPHGFKTPTGWYDEYRRIYELFQRTLHP